MSRAAKGVEMATDGRLVVREHRTESGGAVVVQADVSTLMTVARLLDLPGDVIINTRVDSAVLGLWGDHLSAYEDLKRQGLVTVRP